MIKKKSIAIAVASCVFLLTFPLNDHSNPAQQKKEPHKERKARTKSATKSTFAIKDGAATILVHGTSNLVPGTELIFGSFIDTWAEKTRRKADRAGMFNSSVEGPRGQGAHSASCIGGCLDERSGGTAPQSGSLAAGRRICDLAKFVHLPGNPLLESTSRLGSRGERGGRRQSGGFEAEQRQDREVRR